MTVVMAVGLNTLARGVRTGVASKSRILYINGICAHALLNKSGNLFNVHISLFRVKGMFTLGSGRINVRDLVTCLSIGAAWMVHIFLMLWSWEPVTY